MNAVEFVVLEKNLNLKLAFNLTRTYQLRAQRNYLNILIEHQKKGQAFLKVM